MAQLRISAWAIRNPITVTVMFLALTIAGLFAYVVLPVKQFPDISFPAVTVTITFTGPDPGDPSKMLYDWQLFDSLGNLVNGAIGSTWLEPCTPCTWLSSACMRRSVKRCRSSLTSMCCGKS